MRRPSVAERFLRESIWSSESPGVEYTIEDTGGMCLCLSTERCWNKADMDGLSGNSVCRGVVPPPISSRCSSTAWMRRPDIGAPAPINGRSHTDLCMRLLKGRCVKALMMVLLGVDQMHASRRIFGRLCIVLAVLVTTGGTMSMAATFDVAIDSLYYQDAAGRTLDYDFSSGTMDADGVVTIPSSAYTVAPAESGLALFLEPGGGLQDVSLSGGMYHMYAAQALPALVPLPTAAITVDGSPADWSGVAVYLQDPVGDGGWGGGPRGADVEYGN